MGIITINALARSNRPPKIFGWFRIDMLYNTTHTFTVANFTSETTPPYEDEEGDAMSAVKITTLPVKGEIRLNGIAISVNDEITSAQIAASQLTYVSLTESDGYADGAGRFTVKDVGSDTYSAVTPQAMIFVVSGNVNQAPINVGEGEYDITVGETVVFTRSMLTTQLEAPYEDPEGDIAENLLVIDPPLFGELKLNGILVSSNQVISFTDIDLGLLTYTCTTFPEGGAEGFIFRISDVGSGEYT